jgi:hypothetical protein
MITRVGLVANPGIDSGLLQIRAQRRVKQQMIDAQP